MAGRIELTFNNLASLANTLNDSTSIVVKNGGFETRGKVGSFFTLKSTNRHAGNVLFAAVRQMYGDAVADALAPQMRAARQEGKPLSARTVRDILASAAEMSEGIGHINEDMARHFVLGNSGAGDTRNLDTAFAKFCAGHNIDPAANQALKNRFGEVILATAKQESQKILSYEQLSEMVHTAGTTALKRAWNEIQVEKLLNDPAGGVDAAVDNFAASMGLDGPQKAQLRKVAGMAAMFEADMCAEKGMDLNPQDLLRKISDGSLPGMKNFAYACGRDVGDLDATIRDTLAWATPGNAADLSMIGEQLGRIGGIAACSLAAQRLGVMRQIQPEGMLTRETIWQACFNEALPDELKECKNQEFNNGVFDRLARVFNEVRPNDPTASAEGMTLLATGISMEKTLASLHGPVVLTLADFNNIPTLTPASRLGSLQEVEQSLAKDLKRRGTHNSLSGYTPTISFGLAGGAAETVNIQDTSGMDPQDLASFNAGNTSSVSHDLARRALELCNGNELQARQVIQSMGQSGAFLVRSNSSATGIFESEHSPLDIDIRREENGNITMRYYKPEQSPLDIDYTYTITPDGHGVLTACRMQARQPAPQPAGE